jgi:endonuclease G
MSDLLERLRRFNRLVRERDPGLDEAVRFREAAVLGPKVIAEGAAPTDEMALESIIMRTQRPVLAIKNNDTVVEFENAEDAATWKERLTAAQPVLTRAIPAVGRIELTGSRFDWIGTGWLIKESVLVTNRHVAEAFAMRKGQGFSFTVGTSGRRVDAAVDFLQEFGHDNKLVFQLLRPLWIQPAPGPDVAFFEVDLASGSSSLAAPIPLATDVRQTVRAAVIGYPA